MKSSLFCFNILAAPAPKTEVAKTIAGAYVNVWVVAKTMDDAEILARDHLLSQSWLVTQVEIRFEPNPAQLAVLGPIETASYRKAQRQGISAIFQAWPHRPEDVDGIEICALPPVTPTSQH